MLSGGDGLPGELISSSVRDPSDGDSRSFFDLGVDVLEIQHRERHALDKKKVECDVPAGARLSKGRKSF